MSCRCLRNVGGGDPEQNNGVSGSSHIDVEAKLESETVLEPSGDVAAQITDVNVSAQMKTVVVPAQMKTADVTAQMEAAVVR